MGYRKSAAGSGVQLLRKVLPHAELWSAELDGVCVEKSRRAGRLEGINALIGDQGNSTVLNEWISQSGGGFDAVIDDGSHKNTDILTSLAALWPHLNPGGAYFLTDLGVGRFTLFDDSNSSLVVSDVIQGWVEQLIFGPVGAGWRKAAPTAVAARRRIAHHPQLPTDLAFVACQAPGICVLVKSRRSSNDPPVQGCGTTCQIMKRHFGMTFPPVVGY